MLNINSETWKWLPNQVEGISLNVGVGLGRAILHQFAEEKSALGSMGSPTEELERLEQGLSHLRDEIQSLIFQQSLSMSSKIQTMSQIKSQLEPQNILDVYRLLANDPGWRRQLREKVQKGVSSLEAVDQLLQNIREKFAKKGKRSLWQARIRDFEDLAFRFKRYLADSRTVPTRKGGDSPVVVVADRICPAELLDYDRVAGLLLAEASQTSHVVIVARSLGIPVVGGIKKALKEIHSGDSILIDGNEGRVYLRPSQEVIHRFDVQTLYKKTHPLELPLKTIAPLPAQTRDNVLISLLLNAGLVEDVDYIEAAGAQGIGLYRTEIPFMIRSQLPTVTEQIKLYQEILKRAGSYSVVFRTLDVGGDKVLPYLDRLKSENSIANRRMARVSFDRPILLRYQLRALIRACVGRELSIMLPMVAEVSEVKAVRDLLDSEIEREKDKGNSTPTKIQLGAMIEVPSLVYQLPDLFPYVDFLSVGSNDLFQFFYAIDREYPQLSKRHDVLSSTFLSLLKEIQDKCASAQIPVSVCGEMAGRPLEALALIGLGYRTLSMSAASVPIVKNMILSLTHHEISEYMNSVCSSSQSSIRQNLRDFARDHGIYID